MNDAQRAAAAALEPILEQIAFLPEGLRVDHKLLALLRCRRLYDSRLRSVAPPDAPAVAAVVGGTNVGKSTIYNLLLDERVALPTPTAIGTKSAALSVPQAWREVFESDGFLPWFDKRPWTAPEPLNQDFEGDVPRLYVHGRRRGLRLALIDTPDIDAVSLRNHRTTDDVFHAADAIIFITTPTKYADEVCVEYLARARKYGKRLLIVFNRAPEDDAALRHFQSVVLPPVGIGNETAVVAVPYDEGILTSGGRWKISLRYQTKRLEEQMPEIRAAAQAGALVAFRDAYDALLGLLADEADGVAAYLGAVRRAIDDEAGDHAAFLATMPFDELDQAFLEVLHEQRVPGLDWVYEQLAGVKQWLWRSGKQVAATVRGLLGGRTAVGEDLAAARRERERQQALERVTRLLALLRDLLRDVPSELRDAVAARLPDLRLGDEADRAVEAYLERAESLRRDMVRSAKDDVLRTLREKQWHLRGIRLMKSAARGLTLTLVVVTGGPGAEDLLIAPAADALVKAWLDQLLGRAWREQLQAELARRRQELFAELLDELVRQPIDARVPAACRRDFVDRARAAGRALTP